MNSMHRYNIHYNSILQHQYQDAIPFDIDCNQIDSNTVRLRLKSNQFILLLILYLNFFYSYYCNNTKVLSLVYSIGNVHILGERKTMQKLISEFFYK
jgi:hypothetical protein